MNIGALCSLCESKTSDRLFELQNSPFIQNRLFRSSDDALATKRANAAYYYCPACHFAFNPAFDRSVVDYRDYYNEQIESPTYRRYVDDLAVKLTSDCGLHAQSRILEIGCGSGYFLSRLQAATGASKIVGFDPAYRGGFGMGDKVRRQLFGTADAAMPVDLIVLRHCLEGLLDVEPVMDLVRDGTSRSARLYIEVNDLDYILTDRNPSLLFHEYYRYFSARAVDIFLRQIGFRLERLYSVLGGCYLGITACRAPTAFDLSDAYSSLEPIVRGHRKVVIWGSSGRCISLLSHMSWDKEVVAFGVDIDPAKQGMFMPVTGQKILSPAEAVAFGPDLVIVANEIYAPEIRKEFKEEDVRFVTVHGRLI